MDGKFVIEEVIERGIAKGWGVDTYKDLMQDIQKGGNIVQNTEFQRKFNGFYKVRRGEDWREKFYGLFEKFRRDENVDFPKIVTALQEKTKQLETSQLETSFSSKMLHTLKPDMPIWDENVRKFFKLKEPEGDIDRAIRYYADLVEKFNAFAESDSGRQCVEAFDRLLPSFSDISRTKKVDFFIWASVKRKKQDAAH